MWGLRQAHHPAPPAQRVHPSLPAPNSETTARFACMAHRLALVHSLCNMQSIMRGPVLRAHWRQGGSASGQRAVAGKVHRSARRGASKPQQPRLDASAIPTGAFWALPPRLQLAEAWAAADIPCRAFRMAANASEVSGSAALHPAAQERGAFGGARRQPLLLALTIRHMP